MSNILTGPNRFLSENMNVHNSENCTNTFPDDNLTLHFISLQILPQTIPAFDLFYFRYDLESEQWADHSSLLQVSIMMSKQTDINHKHEDNEVDRVILKALKKMGAILMTILQPRDESTMAMVGSQLYIMGGIGAHTVFLPIIKKKFLIIIVTRIIRE